MKAIQFQINPESIGSIYVLYDNGEIWHRFFSSKDKKMIWIKIEPPTSES